MSLTARYAVFTAETALVATLILFPCSGPAGVAARVTLMIAGGAGVLAVLLLGGLPWRRHPIVVAMLTFLIVSEVSAVLSVVPTASAEDSTKTLLRMLVVALLLICAVPKPEGDFVRARRTAQALVVGGLLLAATGWGMWFGGFQTHWGGLVGPLHYNEICMVLVPILSLAFAFLVTKPSWWHFLICTVLMTTALMTFSRIGWVAIAVLVVLWFWAAPKGRRWFVATATLGGATLALVVAGPNIAHFDTVVDNAILLREDSTTELDGRVMKTMNIMDLVTLNDRLDYAWKPALRLISERPLFGWGYGTSTFAHLTLGDGPLLGHEHNAVLAIAVQSGLVGVVAWLFWLAVLLWRGWMSRRLDGHDPKRWLLTGVAIAVVAEYLVQGLGEPVGNYRMGVLLVVLSAIVVLADGPPVSWLKPGE
ncbi:MAG: O-antigen ligase family protein [Thermoanaerobaculales bacterium]|nr:O-antigen ligase family protein [Thermoanaerobaculales bacterium]